MPLELSRGGYYGQRQHHCYLSVFSNVKSSSLSSSSFSSLAQNILLLRCCNPDLPTLFHDPRACCIASLSWFLVSYRLVFDEIQALKEVPKSGEVWCEGARIHLNPLSMAFDLDIAGRYLGFAVQFTPQYGDSFMECLRYFYACKSKVQG